MSIGQKINRAWQRVSRTGLREGEGVLQHREVIFINRIMFITPVVMLFYIPIEIAISGFQTIGAMVIFCSLLIVPIIFNYFRKFNISKYYTITVSLLFIVFAGLSVGKGTNNHMAMIALALFGVIIFKSNIHRVIIVFIICAAFLFQQWGYNHFDPVMNVSEDIRSKFSIVFFFMALTINFLLAFYFAGLNNEYENIIESQNSKLAEKNKEITDSITYAKRIQTAILPSEKRFAQLFPEAFVLYLPKDIVAGDFYWADEKNKQVLIAAADCTGHGVPGAMVSVVCRNALNRSLHEFNLTKPSYILDKSREIILDEFDKNTEEIKDGMDISLCAFDREKNILNWSGANNPLVLIRNKEVHEYKPDKQPVGKFIDAKPFTNIEIPVQSGDMIYLFSDGYTDQFGGQSGKKFKYKNFVRTLSEIADIPCSSQKEKLKLIIDEWKGNLEQLDDICVIGIRI